MSPAHPNSAAVAAALRALDEGGEPARDVVRDAEEQIVAFANETLQHLSDGDLTLEEDTAPESTKAFELQLRRAGGEFAECSSGG